jgi:hypothetical protein
MANSRVIIYDHVLFVSQCLGSSVNGRLCEMRPAPRIDLCECAI